MERELKNILSSNMDSRTFRVEVLRTSVVFHSFLDVEVLFLLQGVMEVQFEEYTVSMYREDILIVNVNRRYQIVVDQNALYARILISFLKIHKR